MLYIQPLSFYNVALHQFFRLSRTAITLTYQDKKLKGRKSVRKTFFLKIIVDKHLYLKLDWGLLQFEHPKVLLS